LAVASKQDILGLQIKFIGYNDFMNDKYGGADWLALYNLIGYEENDETI